MKKMVIIHNVVFFFFETSHTHEYMAEVIFLNVTFFKKTFFFYKTLFSVLLLLYIC